MVGAMLLQAGQGVGPRGATAIAADSDIITIIPMLVLRPDLRLAQHDQRIRVVLADRLDLRQVGAQPGDRRGCTARGLSEGFSTGGAGITVALGAGTDADCTNRRD
jgi:hypothetical protein